MVAFQLMILPFISNFAVADPKGGATGARPSKFWSTMVFNPGGGGGGVLA